MKNNYRSRKNIFLVISSVFLSEIYGSNNLNNKKIQPLFNINNQSVNKNENSNNDNNNNDDDEIKKLTFLREFTLGKINNAIKAKFNSEFIRIYLPKKNYLNIFSSDDKNSRIIDKTKLNNFLQGTTVKETLTDEKIISYIHKNINTKYWEKIKENEKIYSDLINNIFEEKWGNICNSEEFKTSYSNKKNLDDLFFKNNQKIIGNNFNTEDIKNIECSNNKKCKTESKKEKKINILHPFFKTKTKTKTVINIDKFIQKILAYNYKKYERRNKKESYLNSNLNNYEKPTIIKNDAKLYEINEQKNVIYLNLITTINENISKQKSFISKKRGRKTTKIKAGKDNTDKCNELRLDNIIRKIKHYFKIFLVSYFNNMLSKAKIKGKFLKIDEQNDKIDIVSMDDFLKMKVENLIKNTNKIYTSNNNNNKELIDSLKQDRNNNNLKKILSFLDEKSVVDMYKNYYLNYDVENCIENSFIQHLTIIMEKKEYKYFEKYIRVALFFDEIKSSNKKGYENIQRNNIKHTKELFTKVKNIINDLKSDKKVISNDQIKNINQILNYNTNYNSTIKNNISFNNDEKDNIFITYNNKDLIDSLICDGLIDENTIYNSSQSNNLGNYNIFVNYKDLNNKWFIFNTKTNLSNYNLSEISISNKNIQKNAENKLVDFDNNSLYGKDLGILETREKSFGINNINYDRVLIPGDGNCLMTTIMAYLNPRFTADNIIIQSYNNNKSVCLATSLLSNSTYNLRLELSNFINSKMKNETSINNKQKLAMLIGSLEKNNNYLSDEILKYVAMKFKFNVYLVMHNSKNKKNQYFMYTSESGEYREIEEKDFNNGNGCKIIMEYTMANEKEDTKTTHYELLIKKN